jgi:hypothetical protein
LKPCEEHIQNARKLIFKELYNIIDQEKCDLIDCTLHLIFLDGTQLYITYNDHIEYSYQYLYSKNRFDRERFDNYDKNWEVSSKPHHMYVRGSNEVVESSMNGDISNDIPLLINFLKQRIKVDE